jgi:signal transduction histidine kinase
MTASYDSGLIVISIIIAILASYAALNFAGRVTAASGTTRLGWLAGGAVVMGLGIWSMHFVGMLALHLPVPIGYGLPLMLLSVSVAVAASLLALWVVSRAELGATRLLSAGVLMGAAVCGMHYIGMAAMQADATPAYRRGVVVLSAVIAIMASVTALWLAFRFRDDSFRRVAPLKTLSAIVMGLGISATHYTAMAAVHFAPGHMTSSTDALVLATPQLGEAIAVGALVIIALAIVGTVVDRRVLAERAALTDRLQAQAEQLLEQKEELEAQAEQLAEQAVEQELLNEQLKVNNHMLEDALQEAKRAQKAEQEANASRVKFVNMASHELRTPIGAIGGYAELLLMELRGPINDAQRKDLGRIVTNQKHLLRLINEMLDLAKLEAGQMPVNLGELQLDDILDAAAPMIEPQLMAKSIRYARELEEVTPRVIGDAQRVQQIVINLLANSIKFTPPSGTITVSTQSRDTEVELRVHDSGPGIPSDKVGSLFSPFFQLGDGQKVGGTGLGLAISRELARAMGGELGVEAGEGVGATFILSLRAASRGRRERVAGGP